MFGKQKVVISSMLLHSSCDSFNLPHMLVLPVVSIRREGMGVYFPPFLFGLYGNVSLDRVWLLASLS